MKRSLSLALLVVALPVSAQQSLLDRADAHLIAGEFEQARDALAEWQRSQNPGTRFDPAARARWQYLSARLTTDAARAQEQYLALATNYPTAREAQEALLRVGQGLLAEGDADRAVPYLERLVNDYPAAEIRPHALLWLSRAHLAAGRPASACATASSALKTAIANVEVASALREEETSACAAGQQDGPSAESGDQRSVAPAAASGRFAVQAGAFRSVPSASAIAARLRRLGFEARVAYLPDNPLARVRVGRFRTPAEARAELRRLQQENVDAIIVDDASRERARR